MEQNKIKKMAATVSILSVLALGISANAMEGYTGDGEVGITSEPTTEEKAVKHKAVDKLVDKGMSTTEMSTHDEVDNAKEEAVKKVVKAKEVKRYKAPKPTTKPKKR